MMVIWWVLTAIWAAWLAFIIFLPNQWASLVEKENTFWVKKGLIKETTAEKFAKFEKGNGIKILMAVGLAAFTFLAWLST